MPQFNIFLFDGQRRQINQLPKVVEGVDIQALAPFVIKQIEGYPLGDVSSILIYNNHGEYAERFSISDYLNNQIPKKI